MSQFRVLRLLEYTYTTAQAAIQDAEHWQIPANGTYTRGANAGALVIRSAVLPTVVLEDENGE